MSTTSATDENRWKAVPAVPELRKNEVQVWLGDQDQPLESIDAYRMTMSADEVARAMGFRFDTDRAHFIVARGSLRRLLGRFLDVPPDAVRFQYTKYGKPFLSDKHQASGLKFNISHSGGRMLLAFAIGRELGVDIERVRPDFATREIAERSFSPCEVVTLRSLPDSVQAAAFFNCWTRKEAYIKAIGEGLSCPLDEFDVTLAPGEPAKLLATRAGGVAVSSWAMRSLDPGEGYKAAIVAQGQEWELRCLLCGQTV